MWRKENDCGEQRITGSMATYSEAVDEFSKHATEFLEYIPQLTKARDAYQRAMTVSSEIRSILDAGDETLRDLMAQLEQAVNTQLGRPTAEKKKPESAKVEPIRTSDGDSDVARALP